MKGVKAVILAAGEGTRMRSAISKLLHRLNYQALVKFAANACLESGISRIIVVVGHQAEKVRSILGEGFQYVYQKERLGTGHALRQTVPLLSNFQGELVVLPGDAPFISPSMITRLVQHQREMKPAATVLTALLPDPAYYGRIVRNGYRRIKKIVEYRDASPEQLKIEEINSGIYCFDNQKLLPLLPCLSRNNVKEEYYLTEVIELFHERGFRVEALKAPDPKIVLGVNTPEELKRASRILRRRKLE